MATIAVIFAIAVRASLQEGLGERSQTILLVLPAMLATYIGGIGPGLYAVALATALSTVAFPGWLGVQRFSFTQLLVIALYWTAALGGIFFVSTLRRTLDAKAKAEAELEQMNEQLQDRVRDRTQQLEAANRELERFCYSVAHDLRTPTRAIAGNVRILVEDYGDSLSPVVRDHLDRIYRAAIKEGALVDGLLTYARLANHDLTCESGNIAGLVGSLHADIQRREHATVRMEIQDGPIYADRMMLRLCLKEVLENAIRYRRTEDPFVQIAVLGNGIEITDNGIGFDMAYATKVTEPFERLHRDEAYPGIGMGLAIAQRVTQRHGGSVEIESRLSEGTCIRLNFGPPPESADR